MNREVRTSQNQHKKGHSNAHEYEAVALESELANPSLKSKTSIGFTSSAKVKKIRNVEQPNEKEPTELVVEEDKPRN